MLVTTKKNTTKKPILIGGVGGGAFIVLGVLGLTLVHPGHSVPLASTGQTVGQSNHIQTQQQFQAQVANQMQQQQQNWAQQAQQNQANWEQQVSDQEYARDQSQTPSWAWPYVKSYLKANPATLISVYVQPLTYGQDAYHNYSLKVDVYNYGNRYLFEYQNKVYTSVGQLTSIAKTMKQFNTDMWQGSIQQFQ